MPIRRNQLSPLIACLAAALSLALALAARASAATPITESQITSPSDPAQVFEDETTGSGELTVTGTVNGEGKVDLLCYYGSEEIQEIETEVETNAGQFTATVPLSEFPHNPCVLRAVPTGTEPPAPPGSSTLFKGPRIAASLWNITKDSTTKSPDSFQSFDVSLSSLIELSSVGDFGLESTALFGSPDFSPPTPLFDGAGTLFGSLPPANKRSEIQVDGRNAYDAVSGTQVFNAAKPTSGTPPELVAAHSFDPATALTTVKDTEPLVACSGSETAFPETQKSCETMAGVGVSLEREWQPAANGQLIYMTDTWRSTDGRAHTISADYNESFQAEPAGALLEVPGRSGLALANKGESLPLPTTGGGVIVYQEDRSTPAGGDQIHPFGAIVYDLSPSEPVPVIEANGGFTQLLMPYTLTVPAGGSRTLRVAYAQSLTLPGVRALAAEAFAGFHPSISISAPAGGTAVTSPSIVVSGNASDALGLSSVSVNGTPATIAAGGAWSATVPLALGADTLTATAVNVNGVSSSTSVAVTRFAPPAPPPPVPRDTIKLGIVKVSKGQVTFAITCKGPVGTSGNVHALLQTVERLSRGRVTAVLAGHTKKRTVTIGSYQAKIAAGRRTIAVIKLDATGRKLLARFHKLPAMLTVFLTGANGIRATALTQKLTITPPRHKRRRH